VAGGALVPGEPSKVMVGAAFIEIGAASEGANRMTRISRLVRIRNFVWMKGFIFPPIVMFTVWIVQIV
jgi:hypothetical protein